MRTLEDINYEYIQTELVVKFFMEKLDKLHTEYEEAFEKHERAENLIKRGVKEGWNYYQKGKLNLKHEPNRNK